MSNELLEKVIRTTEVGAGGGGLLNAEQTNRFIDYMWEQTVLGSQVRTIRMRSTVQDIDFIGVGKRIVRKATEAVDDGVNVGATFTKISLTTTKFRIDWELSTESLEDNLEGDALEDHVARLMSTQAANDIEDLSINGDTAAVVDPALMTGFDGWSKRARAGAHVVDFGGNEADRSIFHLALKALPRKYKAGARRNLKFFAGSNVIQDYLFSVQQVSTDYVTSEALAAQAINEASVPTGPAGFTAGRAFGQFIQEVPLFNESRAGDYSGASGNHGDVWLTDPQNLIWGVKREITVYREFKPKKDTIEYTVYTRIGCQIENLDAMVVVKNVKVA